MSVLTQGLANVAQASLELTTLPCQLRLKSTLSFLDTSLAILATVKWYPTAVLMTSDAEQWMSFRPLRPCLWRNGNIHFSPVFK